MENKTMTPGFNVEHKQVAFGIDSTKQGMLTRQQMTYVMRNIPNRDITVGVELPDSYRKQNRLGHYFGGLRLFAQIIEDSPHFKGIKVEPLFEDELYIAHVRILIAQTIVQRGAVEEFKKSVEQVIQMAPEQLSGREEFVANDIAVLILLRDTNWGKNLDQKLESEGKKRFDSMLRRIKEKDLQYAVTTLNYSTKLSSELGCQHVDVFSELRK